MRSRYSITSKTLSDLMQAGMIVRILTRLLGHLRVVKQTMLWLALQLPKIIKLSHRDCKREVLHVRVASCYNLLQ